MVAAPRGRRRSRSLCSVSWTRSSAHASGRPASGRATSAPREGTPGLGSRARSVRPFDGDGSPKPPSATSASAAGARAAGPGRASPGRPRSSRSRRALSRVLGLVREVVASYYFGAGGRINAFTVAFQVPESRSRSRRRRGALVGVRPGLQRADREGRAQARVAGRLEPLLADAARPHRAHGALHRRRAAG